MARTRNAQSVVVELEKNTPKKHSVRFETDNTDQAATNIYLSNEFVEKLGNPSAVRITIEAA